MILENDQLIVDINNEDGSLKGIANKKSNRDAISQKKKAENFRLSIPLEDDWAHIVHGKGVKAKINQISSEEAKIEWNIIKIKSTSVYIKLIVNLKLENDEITTQYEITNNSPFTIDYVWYPIVGGVTRLSANGSDQTVDSYEGVETDDLYRSGRGGVIEENIYEQAWLEPGGIGCHRNRYWYTSREFKYAVYPVTEIMQWISLSNSINGLYFSSKDNRDFYTGFYLEHERESTPMTFSIIKPAFLESYEKYSSCENIVSFYNGSWHVAAGKYRRWMESWCKRKPEAEWIKNLDGWLSFQAHVGDMHIEIPYNDYPKWLEKAKSVGLNAIHVHCGVHDEGIEGGYPYWSNFSKRMGGREKLVEVIKEIQQEGGHIITFTKDNKVNTGIADYEKRFKKHAIKLRDGGGLSVRYPIGTLEMFYSGAQLACMCRADKEWQDFILNEEKIIAETGVDGNMIDEWCSGHSLCFDNSHSHAKPYDTFKGQIELGKKIRQISNERNPGFLLAGEEIWDASYMFMDISFARGFSQGRFYEMYKMCLPWTMRTAEILENDYEHLNYAFSCGLIFALALDYYHSGPEEYPEFAIYVKELITIRGKIRKYFLEGEFRDNLDYRLDCTNEKVKLRSYSMEEGDLIIIDNPSDENEKINIRLQNKNNSIRIMKPYQEEKTIDNTLELHDTIEGKRIIVVELS